MKTIENGFAYLCRDDERGDGGKVQAMTENYEGMCIGGPMDGKVAASANRILPATYHEHERIPMDYNPNSAGVFKVSESVKHVQYQYVCYVFGEEVRGFWALGNATPLEVLDALIAGYKKP